MKKLFLLAGMFFAALLPLACQKDYTLNPLSAGPTATPTPICSNPCGTINCASGITWAGGYVWSMNNNSVNQYGAVLYQVVNCGQETTDTVTMTGPGVTPLPLAYLNPANVGGTIYSVYQSATVTGNLTTGAYYTLTSITSVGTASATLPLPESPGMTTGASGVTMTWNGTEPGCLYIFQSNAGAISYSTGCAFYAASPFYDTTACGSPCENGAEFVNGTYSINGGSGIFQTGNGIEQTGP